MRKLVTNLVMVIATVLPFSVTFASDPEFLRSSKEIFAHPHDIEIDPSGKWLFVSDTNHDNVKVLNAETLELIKVLGEGELSSPHDVHFDTDGRLLVADSGNDRVVIYRLEKLTATLETVLSKNMSSPEGVTSSPDGHIYVASTGNHRILKFFQNRLVKEIGERGDGKLEFVRPHDIELGPDGLLYVGDPGNNRIHVLTESLSFHSTVTGRDKAYREPKYLALDPDNFLYIADQQNNLLRIYDASRRQIGSISQAGGKSLNYIEGVEVKDQRIWVSDTYNDRIVLFSWSR